MNRKIYRMCAAGVICSILMPLGVQAQKKPDQLKSDLTQMEWLFPSLAQAKPWDYPEGESFDLEKSSSRIQYILTQANGHIWKKHISDWNHDPDAREWWYSKQDLIDLGYVLYPDYDRSFPQDADLQQDEDGNLGCQVFFIPYDLFYDMDLYEGVENDDGSLDLVFCYYDSFDMPSQEEKNDHARRFSDLMYCHMVPNSHTNEGTYPGYAYTFEEVHFKYLSEEESIRMYDDRDAYIFADSDQRKLTEEDVKGLSRRELKLARNEIYARKGRKFNSFDLQVYFDHKNWYMGTIEAEDFSADLLSEIESSNVQFLVKWENE